MTTCLYSLLTPLTAGSDKILQSDPHGWTLTLISVSVVFCALLILYGVYSLSGTIFAHEEIIRTKTPKKVRRNNKADDELAAAIGTALHLYMNERIHDVESGIITIKRPGAWSTARNFRKTAK